MWILRDESGRLYYTNPSQPFIIGRNQGDYILKSDGSISRTHAKIEVSRAPEKCTVSDTKSKYGTFLVDDDGDVIQTITGVYIAKPNDRIRFGLQNSILTLCHVAFTVLTSSLTPQDKDELLDIMLDVGGKVVRDWDDSCTHLTVSTTKLTAKLSCALARGMHIVTNNYWRALKNAKTAGKPLPDPKDFCPLLEDSMLLKGKDTSLLPNPNRKCTFKNLSFIHFRETQFNMYKKMIELAGGTSAFCTSRNIDKKVLCAPNTRVVLYNDDNSQNESHVVPEVGIIQGYLKKKKLRMIPDNEIPLAILYASAENCCNPEFSYRSLFTRRPKSLESEILVGETQEGGREVGGEKRVVPESLGVSEAESCDDVGERFRGGGKRSSVKVIAEEAVDAKVRRERKRAVHSEDGHGVREKKARVEELQGCEEASQKVFSVFSCIKTKKVPAGFGDADGSGGVVMRGGQVRNGDLDPSIRRMMASDAVGSKEEDGPVLEDGRCRDAVQVPGDQQRDQHGKSPGSSRKKYANTSKILEESDDEGIDDAPASGENDVDGDGLDDVDAEWRSNRLRDNSRIVDKFADSNNAEQSILRPEIFSGQFFGKTFKKFDPKIPKRSSIIWKS